MNLNNAAILVSFLFFAGLLPSISSLTVLSRAATSGFSYGALTALGIVLGDIIFILIAIYGLSILAGNVTSLLSLLKFLGAVYLIWLGTMQWQSKVNSINRKKLDKSTLWSSLLTGLFITLADQKAILFYLGFFPALLDLSTITHLDTIIIISIAVTALGCAKLCYAYMGKKSVVFINNEKIIIRLYKMVGLFIIAVGCYIMLTTTAT